MLGHGMVGCVYKHDRMVVIDEIVSDFMLDIIIRIRVSMNGILVQSVALSIYDAVDILKDKTALAPVLSVYSYLECLHIAGSIIANGP